MADPQLERLVQKMLDGGADDDTIREAVSLYQAKRSEPLSEKEQATAGLRGMMDAAGSVAPIFAAAGGLMAAPAAISAIGPTVGPAVGRLLSHPMTGATLGAVEGYKRGGFLTPPGVLGGLEGALEGAVVGPPVVGRLGRLLTKAKGLSGGAVRTGAPTAARQALSDLPNALIQTPEQLAARARLMELARKEASEAGMVAAGTKAREPIDLLEQLFGR